MDLVEETRGARQGPWSEGCQREWVFASDAPED